MTAMPHPGRQRIVRPPPGVIEGSEPIAVASSDRTELCNRSKWANYRRGLTRPETEAQFNAHPLTHERA